MDPPAKVFTALLILGLWCALAYVSFRSRTKRAMPIIERWAEQNGFRIVRLERRVYRAGPFTLFRTNVQLVFRVAVRDWEKQVRTGWLLVGNFIIGMLTDEVSVRWDRTPSDFAQSPSIAESNSSVWDRDLDHLG
jgi:hypothetical protein